MDLLLNVNLRRLHHKVGPILPVLAAPDELRIADFNLSLILQLPHLIRREPNARAVPDDLRVEIKIALARRALRQRARTGVTLRADRIDFLHPLGDRRQFSRSEVLARRLVVLKRIDLFLAFDDFRSARHRQFVSSLRRGQAVQRHSAALIGGRAIVSIFDRSSLREA